jgi:uncharacterized membrane protein YfcA
MGDPMQALLALCWSGHMDGSLLDISIFFLATFIGALIVGISGFAFGLVAAAMWLHVLSPVQTATLIIAYGLILQGYAVFHLRDALDWGRLWPFILGAAFGVPAGVAVLGWANPAHVRAGTGAFLILYSLYALLRPPLKPVTHGGAAADAAVGFLNGVLAGITGLAGILVTIWCSLRAWPKDEQRAVFQPAAVAIFLMTAGWLGAKGALSGHIVQLFLLGLPALALGTWLGFKLYGRLDDAAFRKAILVLLLISGAALII